MFVVETCDDGETWTKIGEFQTQEGAVRLRREIEVNAGHVVDSRVIEKTD